MPITEKQTLRQRGRAYPGPSGQHKSIPIRQAIQDSALAEISLLVQAVKIARVRDGINHPRVAVILIDLAEAFGKLGNYIKQRESAERALEINRKNYGDSHPRTAKAHHQLGNAYFNLKEAEKAKEEYEKALKINEGLRSSGQAIDIEFAELCNNLGSVCHALEQYQEAEAYFNKAMPVFKKIEGAESFRVATVFGNLGRVYRGLNNHEQSLKSLDKALLIYKDICGNSHIEVGKILNELGDICYGLAKKEETRDDQKKEYLEQACQHHGNAVTIYKEFYGNGDIAIAVVLDSLADDYRFLGNEEKAEKLYKEELEIRQKFLAMKIENNPDSIETAEEYSNLGDLYRDLGNFEGAIWSYTKELKVKEKLYPKGDDISIASPLQSLGVSHYALKDYKKAAEFYKKALAIQEKHYGPNDPITRKTSEVLNELKALESLERLHETLKEKKENYKSNESFVNHLQLGQALRALADAYGVLKDYKNQKIYLEEAMPVTEKTLGDSNTTFTRILKDLANAKAALGASEHEVQMLNDRVQKALTIQGQIDPKLLTRDRSKNIIGFDNLFHYIKKYIEEKDLKKIRKLVEERNEDINQEDANDGTPLHLACEERKVEIIKYLIEKGAKVNAVNKEGKTPLVVVVDRLVLVNTEEVLLILLRGGADINDLNFNQKQKLISYIKEKGLIFYADAKGYDETVIDTLSSLAPSCGLLYYAKKGNFEGVKRLVEKGANVNEKDDNGITPLHIAAEEIGVDHTKIIEYLLENGADPNVKNKEGETPVHVAVNGRPESLESLLKGGGNPNILNEKDCSPLAKAVEANHHDRSVILLRNGANVSDLVHDRQRQNLISYAEKEGFNDIVTMLAPLVKQAPNPKPKPKPPVRAVLPMLQEASPSKAPDSTAQVRSSDSYGQELQDLCGINKVCSSKAPVPSSQFVQPSVLEAQAHSQFAQASVSKAQAPSSNSQSPSKKKGCILI